MTQPYRKRQIIDGDTGEITTCIFKKWSDVDRWFKLDNKIYKMLSLYY